MKLLALLRQGRLHSSFHLLGHPLGVSSITTRAYNQFPRPDLHRLDKQPYRLHTKSTRATKVSDIFDSNFVLFVAFVLNRINGITSGCELKPYVPVNKEGSAMHTITQRLLLSLALVAIPSWGSRPAPN